MNNIVAAFVAVSSLLGLVGLAGAVYANFRSSALEASNKRLTADNEYYLRKVNYLEPRLEVLERENETLQKLHNPVPAIHELRDQEAENHRETLRIQRENHKEQVGMLSLIHQDLGGSGSRS